MLILGFNLGMVEIALLLLFGLLIFGSRLPEVGRNIGKSIVEFKRGLNDAEAEITKPATKPQATLPTNAPAPTTADLQEQLRLANERAKALEEQLRASKGGQA